VVSTIGLPDWILLFVGAFLFLAIYIVAVPLVGAVSREDLENMREMLKEFGPLSRLFNMPIDLMNRLARSEG